jgi:hypothetical protein
MMSLRRLLAACVGLAFSQATRTSAADGIYGIELGARVGVGLPMGNVQTGRGEALDQTIRAMVPIAGDVGLRITHSWYVGAFYAYAPGFSGAGVSSFCSSHYLDRCSVRDSRLGLDVQYHMLPGQTLDPWMGVGFSFEWLTFAAHDPSYDYSSSITATGWDFLDVQAGLDLSIIGELRGGPFASFPIGEFDGYSWDAGSFAPSSSASFGYKALH